MLFLFYFFWQWKTIWFFLCLSFLSNQAILINSFFVSAITFLLALSPFVLDHWSTDLFLCAKKMERERLEKLKRMGEKEKAEKEKAEKEKENADKVWTLGIILAKIYGGAYAIICCSVSKFFPGLMTGMQFLVVIFCF